LRIASALLLIEAAIGAQLGTLAGLEAFRAIFWVNLLRGALNFPVLVAGAYLWNLRGAVTALVVVAAAAWVINEFAVRRELRRAGLTPRWDGARRELLLLWSFALPASLTGLMTGPAVWAASAMLARRPDGLAALGIFSAADVLRSLVLAVGAPLHAVLLPMLSSREGRASSRVQRVNVLATWMLGLFVAVPAVCFPGVVGWVFGRKFAGAEFNHTTVLVVVAAALASYRQGFGRVLAARSFMWWGTLITLLRVVALLGAMLAARYYGSIGMAMATVVSLAVPMLVFVPFYVRRGLIPGELVWSWEVLWVWIGLAGAATADFLDPPIVARFVVLVALTALVLVMTRRLFRRMREAKSETG
ncbi:MAG: hypothetical protein NTZ61_00035, partial [Proteobacteria bacterium]|nr:hypothetical protein [Pseudomonadota bacterium]